MSMFKSVPVSYPKRRKKKHEHVLNEVQEPVRRTMYDIIMENFRYLKRVTYLHRVIYAGEHSFDKNQSELESIFHTTIKKTNESYTPEKLTGFFLCYSQYFIHMVEGDEDTINNHLRLLLNNKTRRSEMGPIKLLIHLSHVSRRLVKDWSSYCGTPAQYLGKIDIDCGLEESARHVYNCIRKTYNLIFVCAYEQRTSGLARRMSKIKTDFKSSILAAKTQNQFIKTSPTDPYRSVLPEHEIVDFVIKTDFTEDLDTYFSFYDFIPQRLIYEDRIWPCPWYNISFDIFGQPYDAITELSKGNKQEGVETVEAHDESVAVSEVNTSRQETN